MSFSRLTAMGGLVIVLLSSCSRPGVTEPPNGALSRQVDPYTGTVTLSVEYVTKMRAPIKIPRDAGKVGSKATLRFARDPAFGDVVVLQARHECWYTQGDKRTECLPVACGPQPRQVEAHGLVDGVPAQMPPFQCRGWGRAAVDYSASFTRQAMNRMAAGNSVWIRLPTGEVGLDAAQIVNLRVFMNEVEGTPGHLGPESVDLRR